MKKITKMIEETQNAISIAQSFLKERAFEYYKEDYLSQGKILENMKMAQEGCYEIGMDIFRYNKWKQPETLEALFYRLQEKAVIDSDLVDQMIAMYRLRSMTIIEKLDEEDYQKVDAIIRLNFEDIELFLEEVQEFITTQNQL